MKIQVPRYDTWLRISYYQKQTRLGGSVSGYIRAPERGQCFQLLFHLRKLVGYSHNAMPLGTISADTSQLD